MTTYSDGILTMVNTPVDTKEKPMTLTREIVGEDLVLVSQELHYDYSVHLKKTAQRMQMLMNKLRLINICRIPLMARCTRYSTVIKNFSDLLEVGGFSGYSGFLHQ
jgi:hypothetical protein